MSEEERAVLDVRNLTIEFATADGVLRAVNDVSFSLQRGEALGLVGESGCGKSTLARSLLGLLPTSAHVVGGSVMLGSVDMATADGVTLRTLRGDMIAMIFQDPIAGLNPVLNVGTQLVEAIAAHGVMHRAAARARAVELLELVGIPDPSIRMHSYPHELSGGMCQRVMIAMAVGGHPDVLVADEPTTALDVTVEAQILDLLRRLRQEFGMAVLLISHNLGAVAGFAERVGVMYAGNLVEVGTVDDVLLSPRHPYTRGLMGALLHLDLPKAARVTTIPGRPDPRKNLVPGCAFRSRCKEAIEVCSVERPALPARVAGHHAACWVSERGFGGV